MLLLPTNDNLTINQAQNLIYQKPVIIDLRPTDNSINFKKKFSFKFEKNLNGKSVIGKWEFLSSDVTLLWDHKTNIFKLDYSTKNSESNKIEISIQINNDPNLNIRLFHNSRHPIVSLEKEILNSFSFKKPLYFSELKTISVVTNHFYHKLPPTTEKFNIVVEKENEYKTDIQMNDISKKNVMSLFVQIGIKFAMYNPGQAIYKKVTIKPSLLSQGKNITNFADIDYGSQNPFDRVTVNLQSISNLPLSKYKLTSLKVYENHNSIYFDKNMYYDLSKKETIEGFGNNSRPGYVVPYDFYGDIFPILTFDIDNFKNIKLSWTNKINKPYFDSDTGIINLDIKTDNTNDEELKEPNWAIAHNFFEIAENQKLSYEEILKKLKKLEEHQISS